MQLCLPVTVGKRDGPCLPSLDPNSRTVGRVRIWGEIKDSDECNVPISHAGLPISTHHSPPPFCSLFPCHPPDSSGRPYIKRLLVKDHPFYFFCHPDFFFYFFNIYFTFCKVLFFFSFTFLSQPSCFFFYLRTNMICCHLNKKHCTATGDSNNNSMTNSAVVSNSNRHDAATEKICYLCGSTKHASSDCPLYA